MNFKTLCAVLGVMLLLYPGALGEEMPTLILRNGREAAVRLWEKRGDFRLEYGIYNGKISLAEHLRGENPPDLVLVSTYSDDWTGLMEVGLLADLSGNAVLWERVADLRPEMRALLLPTDGTIYGLPYLLSPIVSLYRVPESWQAAGLPETDAPSSYEELLDFLARWLESPRPGFCFFPRLEEGNNATHTATLLKMLETAWDAQCQYAREQAVFSDPRFIALARRALSLGRALDGARENPQELSLFYPRNSWGTTASGQQVTLDDLLPCRITAEQPPLWPLNAELQCVRAGGPWEAACVELTAEAAELQLAWALPLLFPGPWRAEDMPDGAGFTQAWLDSLERCPLTPCLPRRIAWGEKTTALRRRLIRAEITAEEYAAALDSLR